MRPRLIAILSVFYFIKKKLIVKIVFVMRCAPGLI